MSWKAYYIPAAEAGAAKLVRLIFSRDNASVLRPDLAASGAILVAYHQLPSGEAIAVTAWENPWVRLAFRLRRKGDT